MHGKDFWDQPRMCEFCRRGNSTCSRRWPTFPPSLEPPSEIHTNCSGPIYSDGEEGAGAQFYFSDQIIPGTTPKADRNWSSWLTMSWQRKPVVITFCTRTSTFCAFCMHACKGPPDRNLSEIWEFFNVLLSYWHVMPCVWCCSMFIELFFIFAGSCSSEVWAGKPIMVGNDLSTLVVFFFKLKFQPLKEIVWFVSV